MSGIFDASRGLGQAPLLKQLTFFAGFAASIAMGVYVAFWAQTPNYLPIAPGSSVSSSGSILDSLSRTSIPHKIDEYTGQVVVAADKIHEARLRLAQEGVMTGGMPGFELLDKEAGLTESSFAKHTKFLRATQGELARTISQIQDINSARVHIALPKQSAFVAVHREVTASVLLDVYAGRKLSSRQVSAIVNLVATSVPGLSREKVTVIDQHGGLLTNKGDDDISMATESMEYKHRLEQSYQQRITDLLEPIIGINRVKTTVNAELDFTVFQETKEQFDPDNPAVRSEQTMRSSNGSGAGGQGVPGALANEEPTDGAFGAGGGGGGREQSTRNFELNHTIVHTKEPTGEIIKLSVAILVDDILTFNEEGLISSRTPLSAEELESLTLLVRDAIGYNEERGDKISFVNASFLEAPPIPVQPPQSLMDNPWFPTLVKQGVAGFFIFLLIFMVIRPTLRGFLEIGKTIADKQPAGGGGGGGDPAMIAFNAAQAEMANAENEIRQDKNDMKMIQDLVNDDPKRVAQVVRNWVDT